MHRHDHARPDAPPQGLAQVEPGPGVRGVRPFLHPRFPARQRRGRGVRATRSPSVDGRDITAAEFRRTYQAQLQAYRSAYGGNMSEQLLKQLGIEQQILQQMVDERAALAEAERLGIKVSDEEVRAADLRDARVPGERRRSSAKRATSSCSACSARRWSPAEFEDNVRRALAVEKLRGVADRLAVGDRQGSRAGIPAAQRQGEARGRQLHRRQLPRRRSTRPTPKWPATSTRTRTISRSPRSARSATC